MKATRKFTDRIDAITLRLDRQRQLACLLESTAQLLVLNPSSEFCFAGIETLARGRADELESINAELASLPLDKGVAE